MVESLLGDFCQLLCHGWITFGILLCQGWVTFGILLSTFVSWVNHVWDTFVNFCVMGEWRLGDFCQLLCHGWITFGILLCHGWVTFGRLLSTTVQWVNHVWDTFVNYCAMGESHLGYFCATGESLLGYFVNCSSCKDKLKDKYTQRLLIRYQGKLKHNHDFLGYSALCKFSLSPIVPLVSHLWDTSSTVHQTLQT